MERKVLIGIPSREFGVRTDFHEYINRLHRDPNTVQYSCYDKSPAHSRNEIIQVAKENNCTHILFIDDDMIFKPEAYRQLLEHDVDIVSALYLVKRYPHQPLIFEDMEPDGTALFSYLDEPPKKRLLPIMAAGFGFCLIKTTVFDKLEKPYVRLGELDAQEWCDDIGFFKRVRDVGIKAYCDMECLVGHIGTMAIWPVLQDEEWYTGYDTGRGITVLTPQIIPQPRAVAI